MEAWRSECDLLRAIEYMHITVWSVLTTVLDVLFASTVSLFGFLKALVCAGLSVCPRV
jgi:hypothetical protein